MNDDETTNGKCKYLNQILGQLFVVAWTTME